MSGTRVAYFVQSHQQPEQALRLLATLRAASPHAVLVSGHCPRAAALDARRLAALEVHAFRHARPAQRGYWSLVEPYLQAVALLAEGGVAYDWLVHLSGADYPLRPLRAIEAELAASPFDGYLLHQRAAGPAPDGRRRQNELRYAFQYRDLPRARPLLRALRGLNSWQPWLHVHLTYGPRLGVRGRPSRALGGRELWRGSQWTTVRRAAAERLLAVTREEPALVQWFARTICPDEAFAATVLASDTRFRLCSDSRRFVDARGTRDGHPRTLTLGDLEALLRSGCDFGRKVDADVDAALLDALDRRVLGDGAAGRDAATA